MLDLHFFIREYVYQLMCTHNWKSFIIAEDFSKVDAESECYIRFSIKLKVIGKSSAGYTAEYDEENKLIIVTPKDAHKVYYY